MKLIYIVDKHMVGQTFFRLKCFTTMFTMLKCISSMDKENPSLVFSWDREITYRGSTVPVGNEASPSFPLNGGPEG